MIWRFRPFILLRESLNRRFLILINELRSDFTQLFTFFLRWLYAFFSFSVLIFETVILIEKWILIHIKCWIFNFLFNREWSKILNQVSVFFSGFNLFLSLCNLLFNFWSHINIYCFYWRMDHFSLWLVKLRANWLSILFFWILTSFVQWFIFHSCFLSLWNYFKIILWFLLTVNG